MLTIFGTLLIPLAVYAVVVGFCKYMDWSTKLMLKIETCYHCKKELWTREGVEGLCEACNRWAFKPE